VDGGAKETREALDEQLEDGVGGGLLMLIGMIGKGREVMSWALDSSFGRVKVASEFKKDLAGNLSFKVIF
jgi:hypothetical protein